MFSARYRAGQHRLAYEDLSRPEPGPRDVMLEIQAAGLCHSDLHVLGGEIPLPGTFTMGHEAAGVAVSVGEEVRGIQEGGLYAVHGPNPCGECGYCRGGRDNLCDAPTRAPIGLGADGAYAEYLRVPARNVVPVPEGVSAAEAAVATDAVLTPYHALKTLARLQAGDRVVVIGIGGLGLNAVQVARALGAEVIASDVRESQLALALDMGAHAAYHAAELAERLEGVPVDVVADLVGRESSFRQAQQVVRAGGRILLVGLGDFQVPLVTARIAGAEIDVCGSFWGTSLELGEVLQLVAERRVVPRTESRPLRQVGDALEELREQKTAVRLVAVP